MPLFFSGNLLKKLGEINFNVFYLAQYFHNVIISKYKHIQFMKYFTLDFHQVFEIQSVLHIYSASLFGLVYISRV